LPFDYIESKEMNIIPFLIGVFIGLISILLIFLPSTQTEQHFWTILKIRELRHWVTKNKTERWNLKKNEYSLIEISRKNIVWHLILTFIFSFLMLRAQYTNNILQPISHFLLVPILAYFLGSIIQRQKIVILINRKKIEK
jgi:hypothetical protein